MNWRWKIRNRITAGANMRTDAALVSAQSRSKRLANAYRRVAPSINAACRPVLVDMDEVLAKWGGRRLDDEVSALGTVAIEATPAGIKILANLKDVQTVIEDQNVSLFP